MRKLTKTIRMRSISFASGSSCVGVCSVPRDADKHPNKLPFKGVLLLLDVPSNKPPHGARGHRILVPTSAAKRQLSSLIGMGVNYDPGNLDEHVPRHKVGVIQGARIVGNTVVVNGVIWTKDFPEAEKHLKGRKDLGMSMELANVYVRDGQEDVWHLNDFSFTGATILKQDAAAYNQTTLTAKAAVKGEGETMSTDKKKKKVMVAAAGDGVDISELATVMANAVREGNKELIAEMKKTNARITSLAANVDELGSVVIQGSAGEQNEEEDDEESIAAAAKGKNDDDDDDDDDEDVDAKSDDDDDDDMSAGKKGKNDDEEDDDDDDDDNDLDAELEDLEDKPAHSEPGKVNHGMKTKGRKTTTTDVGAEGEPFPNLSKKGVKASASVLAAATIARKAQSEVVKLRKQLSIQAATHKKEIKRFRNKFSRVEAQLEAAADQTGPRSSLLGADLVNLAAKANIDLRDIQAGGGKMTVEQVDAMFAAAGIDVDPVQKMSWKNRLVQAGMMEEGKVERSYTN